MPNESMAAQHEGRREEGVEGDLLHAVAAHEGRRLEHAPQTLEICATDATPNVNEM
jgi:hypothetical protein